MLAQSLFDSCDSLGLAENDTLVVLKKDELPVLPGIKDVEDTSLKLDLSSAAMERLRKLD